VLILKKPIRANRPAARKRRKRRVLDFMGQTGIEDSISKYLLPWNNSHPIHADGVW
jgi:hypothetical protein